MSHIILDGESLNLDQTVSIAAGATVTISPAAKGKIAASRSLVESTLKKDAPSYGINTGFGFLANTKIEKSELKKLQTNILRSHAAGWGEPLSIEETRLAMVLRLNVLVKGFTGVRYELCEALLNLITHEIYPVIPEYGSVGASGDLAPLAHLALPLIGEGEVFFKSVRMPSAEALKKSNLKPIELAEKEGLSLVNGTQIMQAVGGLALANGIRLLRLSDTACALTVEALEGQLDAFNALIHQARGQLGQIETARNILSDLSDSKLFKGERTNTRVQDPYSVRCAPQVHGAARDTLLHCRTIIERELNGATDNPLVFTEAEQILSGGNFHGEPIAMAFDIAAIGLAELGNISERRLELLLNPHFSGLSAFLTSDPGTNSGLMAAQYLAASLVNENKILANPACTDSIPGNVGVEDHVSMGMTSARKLRKIAENLKTILSVELLAAAQAIDLRGIKKLGTSTKSLFDKIRKSVPMMIEDRIVAEDIKAIRAIL